MLRRHTCVCPPASRPSQRAFHALAGTFTTIALATATLAACADRDPTAPTRSASVVAASSAVAQKGGKPTREDVPFPDITLDAGLVCSFAFSSETVENRLVTQTFPAAENGDVLQLTTGTLKVRYTNLATGKTITANISGPGKVTIHPDGSFTQEAVGVWGWIFGAGSEPAGALPFFLSMGRVVFEVSASGELTFTKQGGRLVDLCAALS